MSDLKELSAQIYTDLLPRTSKQKYEKEWQKMLTFMDSKNVTFVTEEVVFAYEASLYNAGYSPPTLRTSVSMLKKVALSKRIDLPNETWARLHNWIDNVGKSHVPRQSPIFTKYDILKFLKQPTETLPIIQQKAAVVVAYCGGQRTQSMQPSSAPTWFSMMSLKKLKL